MTARLELTDFGPTSAATIWIDFLHGDLASQTRYEYRQAAAALYAQAEHCVPAVDLDLALLSPNLSEIERVLSAYLLALQVKSQIATSSHWRLARSFVFEFLRFAEIDTDAMRMRLLEIEQRFQRLRPQAPRPPAPVRALPAEVIEDLHEIFNPVSPRNPYRTEAIRWRNFAIFMLLLHLGLRSGELLGLAAGAIKNEFSPLAGAETFWIDVEIDDELTDPRALPAIGTASGRPARHDLDVGQKAGDRLGPGGSCAGGAGSRRSSMSRCRPCRARCK